MKQLLMEATSPGLDPEELRERLQHDDGAVLAPSTAV